MHGRWFAVLVSVAVVVLVGGVVLLLRGDERAGSGAPPNGSGTNGIDNARCADPGETWQTALRGRVLDENTSGELLLAVSSTGDIVAAVGRDVRLLGADGAARPIYHATGSGQFEGAYIEGTHVVLQILGEGGPVMTSTAASGRPIAVPGSGTELERVVLIDTATGGATDLALSSLADRLAGHHVIDGAAMLNGHVYWDFRPDIWSASGRIHDYDIAAETTVSRHVDALGPVLLTSTGVEWSADQSPPAEVPVLLPPAVEASHLSGGDLTSDGANFAWTDQDSINWATTGSTTPVHRTITVVSTPLIGAVSGPLVVFRAYDDAGPDYLLDTRSGDVTATSISQDALLRSGGGLLVTGTAPPSSTPRPITVYDMREVPALRC